MDRIHRERTDGAEEIRTGLGWRAVVPQGEVNTARELPVVDLADMFHKDTNKRKVVARAMCDACKDYGFFYAKNHGLPDDEVASVFANAKRLFHDVPLEEKMELDTAKHEHYWGYYPIRTDASHVGGKNLNEGMNFGYEPSIDPEAREGAQGYNYWPRESRLPGFQANTRRYMTSVLTLSRAILRLFALGLDLDEDAFDYLATEPYAILKMCFYPASMGDASSSPSSLRPHTDPELLTILLQDDIPSLEVLSNTGSWISAKPIPGTFVVNVGDSMSILTNGAFVSTMHRVRNTSGRDRYSIPFFLGANKEAELTALPQFSSTENPGKFESISSEDYIRRCLQVYYSKPDVKTDLGTIEMKA